MKSPDLKRAEVFRRPWATVRRWKTRDDQHAIEHSRIEYGREGHDGEPKPVPYSDCCRVLARDRYGWLIVSRHRKRTAALRALAKLLKGGS